jgi:hypothetical protein
MSASPFSCTSPWVRIDIDCLFVCCREMGDEGLGTCSSQMISTIGANDLWHGIMSGLAGAEGCGYISVPLYSTIAYCRLAGR